MTKRSPDGAFSLSVVVPTHNEEAGIDTFIAALTPVLQQLTNNYEVICIDDGSNDSTLDRLIGARNADKRIKIIAFTRNFGKESALTAGVENAAHDAVIPIDADLQDPPSVIPLLVAKWQEGWDVVYAERRTRRGESRPKVLTASAFYFLINKMTNVYIPRNVGDFRIMDRRVVEAMKLLPEKTRFMKGLFAWVGFRQTAVKYDRDPRYSGKTKWNYWKLWNFALDGVTGFSSLPLRIWTYVGVFVSSCSFLLALYVIFQKLVLGLDIPGYTAMLTVILFLGGMVLIGLGIIGEYIGRIYEETKNRPIYLEDKSWGIEKPESKNTKIDNGH